jgi:hypothetical protein
VAYANLAILPVGPLGVEGIGRFTPRWSCLSSHFVARVMMIEMISTNTRKPKMPKTNARARLGGVANRVKEFV